MTQALRNRGLTFVSAQSLDTPGIEAQFGNSGPINAATVLAGLIEGRDMGASERTGVPRGSDYERYPNERAVMMLNFENGAFNINEDVIHGLAHVIGVEGNPIPSPSGDHDLYHLKGSWFLWTTGPYDKLLSACKVP